MVVWKELVMFSYESWALYSEKFFSYQLLRRKI